ncbi:MAG: alkaline phosphatase [Elusimicrobium sp.]|jgi:alkaline phosphatase|nr:alkaline phosphatase [Elusimicrobium sp.]
MKKILIISAVLFFALSAQCENAKNIILIISDGGGPATVGLLAQYARYAPHSPYADRKSYMEKFFDKSAVGYVLTNTYSTLATDSAASGTQIATGAWSLPGNIGVDYNDKPVKTILEYARDAGKSTGLITTVYLQDATPAVFAAHEASRGQKEDIAADMFNSGVDVMLGGGAKYFAPFEDKFKAKGYVTAHTKAELESVQAGKNVKLLGTFADLEMPFAIYKKENMPALADMTAKALDILSQNKKGFFLMVEAGRVDWALHANDAAAALQELLELDNTLGYILNWAANRKDTLVILTADHDTGGFAFNYHHLDGAAVERAKANGEVIYEGQIDYVNPAVFDKLMAQKGMFYNAQKEFDALPAKQKTVKELADIFSKTVNGQIDTSLYKNAKTVEDIQKNYNAALGITWATQSHTAAPVPVAAWGATQQSYGGLYHTTDLNKKMMKSFGFGVSK